MTGSNSVLDIISKDTVGTIFDVVPGADPYYGAYESSTKKGDDGEPIDYQLYAGSGTTFIVTYTSFVIAQQASSVLKPHIFYDLALHTIGPDECIHQDLDCGKLGDPENVDPEGDYYAEDRVYELAEMSYAIDAINYGRLAPAVGQLVDWIEISGEDGCLPTEYWKKLLNDKKLTTAEKLRDAYLGQGSMFCVVRPDR